MYVFVDILESVLTVLSSQRKLHAHQTVTLLGHMMMMSSGVFQLGLEKMFFSKNV